jgi:uncharacterized protein with PIN domain
MTSLDEETPGRSCPECNIDLSNLPDSFNFCPKCGADLRTVEDDEDDGDIEGT